MVQETRPKGADHQGSDTCPAAAAPGTWPHPAHDWRGGRVVFPHTTPDGCLVNLYGRTVGTSAQVPKAKRHNHLPGEKGYFNTSALQACNDPLWVCEGACDTLALLAAGVPRVVAIFGVQGWRWDWAREARALVFALDADTAGQQQWRALARQAALRGKRVAVLPPAAYGGCKDVSEAWTAGVLAVDAGPATAAGEALAVPEELREDWAERVAIMTADGSVPHADASAWRGKGSRPGGRRRDAQQGHCCSASPLSRQQTHGRDAMTGRGAWQVELVLTPGARDALRVLTDERVEAAREEPGVLRYERCISVDGTVIHVDER